MNFRTHGRFAALAATGAALALVASGCAPAEESSTDANGNIKLTVATYGDFGYTEELLEEYEAANPGIDVVQNKAAEAQAARDNYFTKLGAGSGLADVEAVDRDWFAEVLQFSDKLYDLSDPSVEDRWLDFKYKAALDEEGRLLGYGTDIGPQAICYRSDLFAAAGLPTDRAEVATLLEGDWDRFGEVAREYTAKTGKPFIDAPSSLFYGRLSQIEQPFEDGEGNIIATTNPEVEDAFRDSVKLALDVSAGLPSFSEDWFAGMVNGTFATMPCPAWMLGILAGNAPDVKTWDIANVYPGGGSIWGESYLTVPAQGKNLEEAKKLANWLTAPEQQIKAFINAGPFPSQVEAYTDPALTEATNEYFNNAPIGQIYVDRAEAVKSTPFKGPDFFKVYDIVNAGITRAAEEKSQSVDESWAQVVTEIEAL